MSDKQTGWLANLKVGDKVIIDGMHRATIHLVEKVTPIGRIVVDGTQYDDRGTHRYDTWNYSHLREATPDAVEKVMEDNQRDKLENNIRNKFHTLIINKLSTVQLIHLSAAIDEVTE
jgi:hypothetical protein